MSAILALAVSTIAAQTVTLDATQITVTTSTQRRIATDTDIITLVLSASDPREWEAAVSTVEEAERRIRKILEKDETKGVVTVMTSTSTATPPNGGSVSQTLEVRLPARPHTRLIASRLGAIRGVTSLTVTHDVADRVKAQSDARREAVATARAKAEDYATAAGRKLGKVQSLVEMSESIQPPYQATWLHLTTSLTLKISLE
ncbi:MAG: SIMPL domain-containing protein [Myxococcaceae bacterium]|nr:SIMPL domain-containing protein [Myxococcaceae bacterium]